MIAAVNSFIFLLATFLPASLQDPNVFAIESWKRGTRQIQEQTFGIRLDTARPEFEKVINDVSGKPKYKLVLWPGRVSEDDSDIVEWIVELTDITRKDERDLLKPSNDPEQDYFSAKDRVGWLYPMRNARSTDASDVVPIFTKRQVRIEGFYLLFEVKDFRFKSDTKGLSSIAVEFQFINSQEYAKRGAK